MEFKNQQTLSPLTRFLIKVSAIYIRWYLIYDYYLLNLAGGILNIFGWDIYSETRHFI